MNEDRKKRGFIPNKILSTLAIAALFTWSGGAMANETASGSSHGVNEYMQAQAISGVVVDTTGEPVIGASVLEKGTSNGTITDINGNFKLNVRPGATLTITYIGYKNVEIRATNSMRIVMQEDSEVLDEVVVVGYGTQKRENLTGAVATVDVNKALSGRPIADVGRGLQGTTPGLSVVIPSGEVGSDPTIKIRGQLGSIDGGSSPLILLDNVEIPSIQMVNPDDIESISVLKDAASASIYGAKAAFGVVLITTKKGAKTESVNVSYSGNVAWQNISKKMEMAGIDALGYTVDAFKRTKGTLAGAFWYVTEESYKRAKEWQENWGDKVGPHDPMVYGRDWYVDANNRKLGLRTYDPYDYMIREWAPSTTHNLSVNGKSGNTTYNIGLGYLDQNGLMKTAKHDDFKRYNASIRLSTELNKYITVRAGAIYSKRNKRYAYATSYATADPWLYLYRWGPIYPMTTEDGDPIRGSAYEAGASNTANRSENYTNINIGALINITKDWTVDIDFTHANNEAIRNQPGTRYKARDAWSAPVKKMDASGNPVYVNKSGAVVPATDPEAMQAYQLNYTEYTGLGANPDHVYRRSENSTRNTFNAYTTYNLNIADAHAFKFMAGMNRVTYDEKYNWSQKTTLLDINNPQFDLAVGTQTAGGGTNWEAQLGYYGRINYSFKDRYLVEGNLRYDGTSKFTDDMKWRWFPSFSLGWRATEEPWLEFLKPTFNSIMIRGSYGTIGDQTVSNKLYLPIMSQKTTNWLMGSEKLIAYNTPTAVFSEITWQDVTNLDLGLNLRMLDNRLGVTFDWYQRDTKNMIVPVEGIPTTYGLNAPKGNFGSLRTRGWEIAVDFNHRFNNGLGINLMGTISDAITEITAYGDTKSIDSWYVGKRAGEIWGYRTDRLYQKEDFEYDANGELILITLGEEHGSKNKGKKAYKLKGDNPVYQAYLQNSTNFYFGPGDVKFIDKDGDGQITDGARSIDDHGDLEVIGNSNPRYEYGFRLGADYKGFDFSVFFQGVGKRHVWGEGFLAIPGFNSSDGAMPQAIAGNYWREDRTDAFYPRAWNFAGSILTHGANNLHKQDRYLLNMAYLRMKNITLGYTLPKNLVKKAYMQNARVYVALENFLTFDNLNDLPIDPEEVSGYSMFITDPTNLNYNGGRTGVGTPTSKSVSIGVQLNF